MVEVIQTVILCESQCKITKKTRGYKCGYRLFFVADTLSVKEKPGAPDGASGRMYAGVVSKPDRVSGPELRQLEGTW